MFRHTPLKTRAHPYTQKPALPIKKSAAELILDHIQVPHKQSDAELYADFMKKPNLTEAELIFVAYLDQSANQGTAKALCDFARKFAKGDSVQQDAKIAFTLYLKAAEQGHAHAQYQIAHKYQYGTGVTQDYLKAIQWYQKSAAQNHMQSLYELSECYELGCGTERDEKKAVEYLEKAAVLCHKDALHKMAMRYELGRGVPLDLEKSQDYHERATRVQKSNAFYQWFLKQSKEKNLPIYTSMLLLKVKEIPSLHRSLYSLLMSKDIDLSLSYVPCSAPKAKLQRGPTCGLFALEVGSRWGFPDRKENLPLARKHAFKPTLAEKEKAKEEKVESLRSYLKKIDQTTYGEVYDVYALQDAATYFDLNTHVVKSDAEHFAEKIIETIRLKHSLVLPVNIDNITLFPSLIKDELHLHYGLAYGFVYRKSKKQYELLVTHYGYHCLWPMHEYMQSLENLPSMVLRKHRYKNPVMKEYFPTKDPSGEQLFISIENFKYCALAIPTVEDNFLALNDCYVTTSILKRSLARGHLVRSKLFFDKGVKIQSEDFEKAIENIDDFSKNELRKIFRV